MTASQQKTSHQKGHQKSKMPTLRSSLHQENQIVSDQNQDELCQRHHSNQSSISSQDSSSIDVVRNPMSSGLMNGNFINHCGEQVPSSKMDLNGPANIVTLTSSKNQILKMQDKEQPVDESEIILEKEKNFLSSSPLPQVHIDLLNSVCESVFTDWSPGISELNNRRCVIDKLAHHIRQLWPSAILTPYGSSCNGFTFKNSDLDLSLTFRDVPSSSKSSDVRTIRTLAKFLAPIMSNVTGVTSARVPIVKLIVPKTNVEVDISLYNELGSENSQLLYLYATFDPRLRKLGYMAKLLAKTCSIGDASQGSLSSYAHILMMIFFLQQVSPPVVPVLQEMYPPGTNKPKRFVEGWNAWFLDLADIEEMRSSWDGFQLNTMSVGELWIGFLNFYASEFDSECMVVSIRQMKPLSKQEKKWSSKTIAIEDPFELTHNLGGTSNVMDTYIKQIFVNARKHFLTQPELTLSRCQDIQQYFFKSALLTDGPPPNQKCQSCRKTGHLADKCPLFICRACKENGHLEKDCKETPEEKVIKKVFLKACKGGDVQELHRLLQDKKLDINCQQGSALHWAVRKNQISIVKILLEQPNIEINYTDRAKTGNTVLHWACYLNLGRITKKLLSLTDRGNRGDAIKCNEKNSYGNTPLMEAALNGSMQSLNIMLACPQVKLVVKTKGKDKSLVQANFPNMSEIVQNLIRNEKIRRKTEKPENCLGSAVFDASENKINEKQESHLTSGLVDGKGRMTSNDSDSRKRVSNDKDDSGTIIERQYLLGESTLDRLKEMGGVVVENINYTDIYYDTEDLMLLRKGIKLRKRVEWDSKNGMVWKILYLHDGRMLLSLNREDVESRLGEALGVVGGSLDEIVVRRLAEIRRTQVKVVRYRLGKVELELVQEEALQTICVQLVGDVLSTLADLDDIAQKLNLKSFDMSENNNGKGNVEVLKNNPMLKPTVKVKKEQMKNNPMLKPTEKVKKEQMKINSDYCCNLCGLTFKNKHDQRNHLEGKKHLKNLKDPLKLLNERNGKPVNYEVIGGGQGAPFKIK